MDLMTLVLIAISAVGFARVLTQPNEIMGWYANILLRVPEWIAKPLGGCAKCFGGQVAFWYYITIWDNLFNHLLFTLSVITLTYIIELIINRYE